MSRASTELIMPRTPRIRSSNNGGSSRDNPRHYIHAPLSRGGPNDNALGPRSAFGLNGANLSRFNALHGDRDEHRRNTARQRYWRFNEWSRNAAMAAAVVEETGEEVGAFSAATAPEPEVNKNKPVEGDGDKEKETKILNKPKEDEKEAKAPEGVETPPGFRWVYIEIV